MKFDFIFTFCNKVGNKINNRKRQCNKEKFKAVERANQNFNCAKQAHKSVSFSSDCIKHKQKTRSKHNSGCLLTCYVCIVVKCK